uniref:Lipid-binding serum glycoprotein C-terminal domain-containing protein n=1 Tax=Parascaris univalens TaxID=6257 RepID=A0A915B8V5_PARUN
MRSIGTLCTVRECSYRTHHEIHTPMPKQRRCDDFISQLDDSASRRLMFLKRIYKLLLRHADFIFYTARCVFSANELKLHS